MYLKLDTFIVQTPEFGEDLLILKEFCKVKTLSLRILNKINEDYYAQKPYTNISHFHGVPLLATNSDPEKYSYPLTFLFVTFLVPFPTISNHWYHHLSILNIKIWLLIISAYLITGIYFWFERKLTTCNGLSGYTVLGMFLMQGIPNREIPTFSLGRIMLLLLLVVSIIYSSVYSSGIVSTMIKPEYENVYKTLDDLTKTDLPIDRYILPKIPFDLVTAQEKRLFSNTAQHITEKRKAVISYRTLSGFSLFLALQMNSIYELRHLKENILNDYTHVEVFGSYWIFLPDFNLHILHCKEAGLTQRWEWEGYLPGTSIEMLNELLDAWKEPELETVKLTFWHLAGIFWISTVGVVFGCLLLFLECVIGFFKRITDFLV